MTTPGRDPEADPRNDRALRRINQILGGLIRNGSIVNGPDGFVVTGSGSSGSSRSSIAAALLADFDDDFPEFLPGPRGPRGFSGSSAPGGFQLYNADITPDSPSADDDEFDTGSLDTGVWTVLDNDSTLTVAVGDYGLLLTKVGVSGDSNGGIFRTAPVGDFSIVTKVQLGGYYSNYTFAGLFIAQDLGANPTTADMHVNAYFAQEDGGTQSFVRVLAYSAYNSFAGSLQAIFGGMYQVVYLRIRRISSDIFYDVSGDGVGWINITAESSPFTISTVGLFVANATNAGAPDAFAYFRFWRMQTGTALNNPILGGFTATEGPAGPSGSGGGSVLNTIINGRLTLTSATPVTTSDVTGASTIYFTPYRGGNVSLYNGTSWQSHTLTEVSLALSGLTSGKNYDVFLYNNSGTLTLELSAAWTNDTTRADAIALQNGVVIKSGFSTRRLVGTIRTTGTTTTESSRAKRFVSNLYNEVELSLFACPGYNDNNTATNLSITSSSYDRVNGGTNDLVEFVSCESREFHIAYKGSILAPAVNSINVGIGLDSITNASVNDGTIDSVNGSNFSMPYDAYISAGYHYIQQLATVSGGTGTIRVDGDRNGSAADPMRSYMTGYIPG